MFSKAWKNTVKNKKPTESNKLNMPVVWKNMVIPIHTALTIRSFFLSNSQLSHGLATHPPPTAACATEFTLVSPWQLHPCFANSHSMGRECTRSASFSAKKRGLGVFMHQVLFYGRMIPLYISCLFTVTFLSNSGIISSPVLIVTSTLYLPTSILSMKSWRNNL